MGRQAPGVQAKVDFLRQPAAYPGQPAVEVIETHMSWVFLAGEMVYKLKKPVSSPELDFRSLEARHFYCMEELRLNRPLAGGVYLDVVALMADDAGALRLGGPGTVVDWLVRMRRLPAQLMLDRMLEEGRAGQDDLRALGRRLAGFYGQLEPVAIDPGEYRDRLERSIGECERELCEPAFGLDADGARGLCARMRSLLQRCPALFDARVQAGRIVEGHGDLRPEHVYLGTPPAIIDRLEFSMELRTLDAIDEVAYLALECQRLGAPELGGVLLDTYRECAADDAGDALVHFYQCLRACIRGRLAIRHLREAQYRDSPKWPARARQYLRLAGLHMRQCEPALAAIPPAAP